jgi:hypothetical protein
MIVTLPRAISFPVPGCSPVIISRDDMTSDRAWYKLAQNHDAYLERTDFIDRDLYYKYWFISLGIPEYCLALVVGPEGSGKSLILAWLSHELYHLFGKKVTLDWRPPDKQYYGDYHFLHDEDYATRIQKEMNDMAKYEDEIPVDELHKLIVWNTAMSIDEGDSLLDKSNRTNLAKLFGRLIRRRRHFHLCMFIVFVDPNDADVRLVYNRRTHEITCGYEWFYRDTCTYKILHKRTGVEKYIHIQPKNNTHLWKSFAPVVISHEAQINLGGKDRKREKEKDLEEAIDKIRRN